MSRGECALQVRQVVFAGVWIKEMSQGKIGDPVPDCREAGATADRGEEEGGASPPPGVQVCQDAKTRVVAAGGQEGGPFVFLPPPPWTLRTVLDPLVDERLRKDPFAGHPGTRDLPRLGEVIDLLLVDAQVGGDLFGGHEFGHPSLLWCS